MEHYKLIRTDSGYHFVLIAKNSKTIGQSEIYVTMAGAENGIRSVRVNSQIDARFEDRISTVSKRGKFYFVVKGGNGEVILLSENYKTRFGRMIGKMSVKRNGKTERTFYENIVIGIVTPTIELFKEYLRDNGLVKSSCRIISKSVSHSGVKFDKIVDGYRSHEVGREVVEHANANKVII